MCWRGVVVDHQRSDADHIVYRVIQKSLCNLYGKYIFLRCLEHHRGQGRVDVRNVEVMVRALSGPPPVLGLVLSSIPRGFRSRLPANILHCTKKASPRYTSLYCCWEREKDTTLKSFHHDVGKIRACVRQYAIHCPYKYPYQGQSFSAFGRITKQVRCSQLLQHKGRNTDGLPSFDYNR